MVDLSVEKTMSLPKVFIDYPYWPNSEWSIEKKDSVSFYVTKRIEAEVLTLHLKRRTMRVRVMVPTREDFSILKPASLDVGAKSFFDAYRIEKK